MRDGESQSYDPKLDEPAMARWSRSAPINVAIFLEEPWLEVKCQTNSEIAGKPRKL